MHAVVIRVSIKDEENAQKALTEEVVPRVSHAPGFVAGHWTKSDDGTNGMSLLVFESEDAARTASERIGANVPEAVTLESIEVREIVAKA